jgi:hypothetical protein
MLQYWSENPLPRAAAAAAQPRATDPEQTSPEANSAAIQAYIRDIAAYAERIDDLGPHAIAGLIFNAHSKLQNTLIPTPQHEPHIQPTATSVPPIPDHRLVPPRTFEMRRPALLPSPVIVRPGTGELSFLFFIPISGRIDLREAIICAMRATVLGSSRGS